jgi:clorobiocin/coumermycin A biosynthesis protein CloN6/CouN6
MKMDPVLPAIQTDLLLLHPPAVFDFRNRSDIYFPFLGTSGDVPITPLYEYFPVGFKKLQRYLSDRDYRVKIINLGTLLLKYPALDFKTLIGSFDSSLIGIDLHWMVHVQGSLAIAEMIKKQRPDLPVILGGISSTYYASELINYPFIDFIMRGYDTLELVRQLIEAIKSNGNLHHIANLLWKSTEGKVQDNGFSYVPATYGCGIDWSNLSSEAHPESLPILEFVSTQNAGCAYNCGWCGGSREAFQRIYGTVGNCCVIRKPAHEISYEFDTLSQIEHVNKYHFYSVGSYNESSDGMNYFLDRVAESNFKSISYEQYHLTDDATLQRMVAANKRTIITLSPESHDIKISKLAGRGVYSNQQLESWIARALDYGIYQIDIWYFVGMPEQDEKSVMQTVEYCEQLLEKFKGHHVYPLICPMIPFLDPGSTFFENPGKYGYRIFYRTVEEHRRAMKRASIINRINYETQWLSRHNLVHVGFKAVRRLMEAKKEVAMLPRSLADSFISRIDDALDFIDIVHEADCIADETERQRELNKLKDEILKRNEMVFFSGVINQAFPITRAIGGRWFDELGWESPVLEAVAGR